MDLKNSKTRENLEKAFFRESGAFNEYTFFAEQAKAEGYEDIYNTFTQFALNEQAHAKIWFKLFHGIEDTEKNLLDAEETEHFERTKLYSGFSKTAYEEGFDDIAALFEGVAKIENTHENTYKQLKEKVKNNKIFSSDSEEYWICLNCGHIEKGKKAPEKCPVCSHPISYFKIKN